MGDEATIMVIDDDESIHFLVEHALGPLNRRVLAFESGREATPALSESRIAVILLDVRLAAESGFEYAKVIRANPQTTMTPIIFLTGLQTESDRAKG